jgi:hypothetical protein
MGSVGDACDNAMSESFFATLECELLDRRKFKTKARARIAIFQFIEGWYNPGRRHSALGYMSPIRKELLSHASPIYSRHGMTLRGRRATSRYAAFTDSCRRQLLSIAPGRHAGPQAASSKHLQPLTPQR